MEDIAHSPRTAAPRAEADGTAVAAFVLGLLGLFFFNVVLGPFAIGLAATALIRGTARRGRALLGLALGAADLVVMAVLVATHHGIAWSLGS
ncbi:DUF4190 domain-containing protein [Peterkaempfera sp. SMS 1(5)a]|uniref:DUF4190 domain-containing protein n=1 Tax=Peterkaempfera podocarpi TaxID=3232308 RepID=UPI003671FAE9